MATLPKPRYSSSPAGREVWPVSEIHPVPAKEPEASDGSSLLDLQAPATVLPADAVELESISQLSLRLKRLAGLLRWVGRWWLALDFRRGQLPILVLAIAVWAITARAAWRSEESGTAYLRESISQIRQERARAAAVNSRAAAANARTAAAAPTVPPTATPESNTARSTVPAPPIAPVSPRRAAEVQFQKRGSGAASELIASIRSWFSPEPAAPERVLGNPHRRVWVDLKTGLYYCPGTDYYGHGGADRGKVMSQKDAEYEYFQPAAGAPCR